MNATSAYFGHGLLRHPGGEGFRMASKWILFLWAVCLLSGAASAAPTLSKEPGDLDVTLRQLSSRDAKARRGAAMQLGQRAGPKSVAALLKALKDPDELVRQAAADSLGAIKSPESAEGLASAARHDSKPDVRQAALVALIAVSEQKAIPLVIENLKDTDVGVRKIAVTTLARLKTEAAVPQLLDALAKSREPAVQSSILQALGAIGSVAALKPVYDQIQSPNAEVQMNAIRTFGTLIENMGTVSILEEKLRDRNPEIESAAAYALAKLGNHSGLPVLIELISSSDKKVRSESAEVLAAMKGETQAAAALENALKKESDAAVKEKIGVSLKVLAGSQAHKK